MKKYLMSRGTKKMKKGNKIVGGIVVAGVMVVGGVLITLSTHKIKPGYVGVAQSSSTPRPGASGTAIFPFLISSGFWVRRQIGRAHV